MAISWSRSLLSQFVKLGKVLRFKCLLVLLLVFLEFKLLFYVQFEILVLNLLPLVSVHPNGVEGVLDLLFRELAVLSEGVQADHELDILGLELLRSYLFPGALFRLVVVVAIGFGLLCLLLLLFFPDPSFFLLLREFLLDDVIVLDTSVVGSG